MVATLERPTGRSSRALGLVLIGILCAGALILSMAVGSRTIPPAEILHFLIHPDAADPRSQVVWQSRVPRTFLILVAGAALGVAGGLMQAVTRNPMTDPGILGVNAGASLFVVVGLAFFGLTDISQYMWWSFIGAIVTSVAVFSIGNTGPMRGNPVRMVLLQSWAESSEDSVSHSLMAPAGGRCQAVSNIRLTITASGFGCP